VAIGWAPVQPPHDDFCGLALANGIIPSVGHTGICFDNAVVESFNVATQRTHPLAHLADFRPGSSTPYSNTSK